MRKTLREILQTALMAVLMFAGLQVSVQTYRVEGSSMQETLQPGQYLLVNKLVYYRLDMSRLSRILPFLDADSEDVKYVFHPPARGEIVVFHYPLDPTRDFVKRVIGLPGDTVEIRDGVVVVNDGELDDPYVVQVSRAPMRETVLGPDEYFVLGDNRLHSNDSRNWGPVPLENIVGRAWIGYWPLSDFTAF
jgi:signal peptidase I